MTQQIYILDSFETDYTNIDAADVKILVDQSEESSNGTVQSVTGYSVDNTDVNNPVVNAVPLSGTEGGSPVTGDIEFTEESSSLSSINANFETIVSLKDGLTIETIIQGVLISKSISIGKGIITGGNYILPTSDNDFTQKKYVDDTKNIGKTFENLTATGAIDIDVSLYDSIKLHLTGNTTLTFINTPTGTKTKAINMVVTTENGTETLGLSSATNYYYAGEFDASIRNKFAIDFSSYTTTGLEVDVFINETTNI